MYDYESQKQMYFFEVDGKQVETCREAWMMIYGVSENRMNSIKKRAVESAFGVSKRASKEPCRPKEDKCVAFMNWFLSEKNSYAQKMPNPRGEKDEYHLPTWMTKRTVYQILLSRLPPNGNGRCALSVAFTCAGHKCSLLRIHLCQAQVLPASYSPVPSTSEN